MGRRASLSTDMVGQKLRELRKANNFTLQELEEKVGIHRTVLSRMERGHYRVTVDTLLRIVECFGIEARFPFWESEPESLVQEPTANHEEQTLLDGYRRLDPNERREVLEIVEARLGTLKDTAEGSSGDR